MEQLKQLLSDMKKKEELRTNATVELNAEMARIDLRQETETERYMTGIKEDINAGIYNHITAGKMNQLIDEQKVQIEEKYNAEREDLNKKLEELNKKNSEEKTADYKKISAAINEYHLDMVLESNKAQKDLEKLESERDKKIQEIESNIKQKEAQRTHLIMKNRRYMDVETSVDLGEINSLELEIEKLKDEKDAIANEYSVQIEKQNEVIKQCLEQKERAAAFLGKIILSEKTIDEISNILFGEKEQEELGQDGTMEGTPAAGEPVVGEPETGTQVAGEPVASEPAVGTQVTGEPVVSEPTIGTQVAGEPVVSEPEVGTPVTGEPVVSEPTVGTQVAGEPVAGTQVVGEPSQRAAALGNKKLNKIVIQIGKNRESITIVERDGDEPIVGEALELEGRDWQTGIEVNIMDRIAEKNPKADKWVISEVARNYTAGLLSKEEVIQELQVYLDIINGKDVEENKNKLKLDLHYDLTELKGLDRETKKELKRNARQARKLGIAEVETHFTKAQKWVKEKWNDFTAWGKNLLPQGKGTEALPEPENNQNSINSQEETRSSLSYGDRIVADLDAKGAFNQAYKPKEGQAQPVQPVKRQSPQEAFRANVASSYYDKLMAEADEKGTFAHSYTPKPAQTQQEPVGQDGEELEQ